MGLTFAIVGHNEAPTLSRAMSMCIAGANTTDRLVFVDSASTDGSKEIARDGGFECWAAPLGKGLAVREALRRCETEWLVLLDGDIHDSEKNVARILSDACRRSKYSMVLGDFDDKKPGGVLSNTWGIYDPLVSALFPEIDGRCGSKPLTGFRGLRKPDDWLLDFFPPDFGVEAHLNIAAATRGRGADIVDLGWYLGAFRYKPHMGVEIGAAVLRAALAMNRLTPERLSEWEAWVMNVADVVATFEGDPDDRARFLDDLARVRSRELPPVR